MPPSLALRKPGGVISLTVTTGGSGYTAPPTVSFSGGSGTGAAAVAVMNGTMVASLVVTQAGSGYTSNPTVTISGNAQAEAYAYTGSHRRASFMRSRFNDMYVIDGMGRGLRWNGDAGQMQPVGIVGPVIGPKMNVTAGDGALSVASVDIMKPGAGYTQAPTVSFAGGSPTTPAAAVASIAGGRVSGVRVTESGAGYTATPTVTLSGGQAGGASFSVGVSGGVASVEVVASGTGYTGTPTVTFSSAQGLTKANAVADVTNGAIQNVAVLASGSGATTSGVTASVAGAGSGASLKPVMAYRVTGVTVTNGGTGFYTPPTVTVTPDSADQNYTQAYLEATINSTGGVASVRVLSGGQYSLPPTAVVLDGQATATASMSPRMSGKYKCAIRYLDSTPVSQQGPIPSSISELVEVDAGASGGLMTWNFTHPYLEDRVSAMELWRTTADQSVALFRVATIQRTDPAFFGSYADKLSDNDLTDTERDGYGLMPVTLPSGQINARRFEVPPGNYGVAVMFQDRAWFAVDTTGKKPNSLLFSEVDEPESVPPTNEIVVQESIGDSDAVVALIPMASALLIAQSRHLYKLQYVAQPIIDASILLASYRGVLNNQCWDVMGGVAFIADSFGLYAYDGNSEQPVSAPVDNLWRDRVIDFTQSDKFHVKADYATKTVRFYFCRNGETSTARALCYCVSTQAWWEEEYPSAITASANMAILSRQDVVYGAASGFVRSGGFADAGSAVSFRLRTGNMPLTNADKGSRTIGLLYAPTADDANLTAALHYNNSPTARPNAIGSDRGEGFVSTKGATGAVLNLKRRRSQLGDASGFAKAYYAGNVDDKSAGADRHVAVSLTGQQSTAGNAVVIHGVTLEGAGG
ncbi:MAG: hypothetical protein EBR82_22790 [Caulobacteraceae bacterium]|nr:hypothetical protein [Caulobacteraceae bacterium]